jgi:hypothetical protein
MLSCMQQRRQTHADRFSPWRLAFLLLVLFAANAQQLVAQTHWHAAMPQVGASADASPAQPAPGTLHDDCLLCQIAAHAGAVAPPPAMLPAGSVTHCHAGEAAQSASLVCVTRPSHAWQSRGPPTA